MRSGGPKPSRSACQYSVVTAGFALGMSAGLPSRAPWSTHAMIVSIWSSLSDMSFLNFWTPTLLSMCHGGIWRAATRARIDLAHGRASR
jgi:hypothetical protein